MGERRLAGQTAWISGGASGMGEATAELFAAQGARVVVVDVQEARGRAVAERMRARGGEVLFAACDVAREEQVRASIERTVQHFGGLNILVNCAGIVHVGPLHEYAAADWHQLLGVNLNSIFFAVKHAIPHLRRHARSYIVNVGSVSSYIGQAHTPAYIASKHAVLGLTRAIALDYAADGVRCNCVCPGITDTPLLRYHLSKDPDPEQALANRLRRVPTGVALTSQEIARAILYFSCEDSAGITGTSLVIDGGYTATAEWETPGQTRFMDGV